MDSDSDDSALKSLDVNQVISNLDSNGDGVSKAESNGSVAVEQDKQLSADVTGEEIEDTELLKSPKPVLVERSLSQGLPSPGTVTKGYGLRKWRRIRREVSTDGVVNVDSSKLLKRGLSNAGAQPGKPMQFSAEMKQTSEGSVSSTNAIMRIPGGGVDGFVVAANSRMPLGPVFTAGTDSENSEDRSSKSSTAASVPKMRYEGPLAGNKMRSLSGKNSSAQKVEHGKVRTGTSKKPRGERVKIEKENSLSSLESDLRSSNFLVMQGSNSYTSNGRQNGKSINYGGENSDEAQGVEREVSEEIRTGYGRVSGDFEDVSQADLAAGSSWGVKVENSENQGCSTDHDPLIESIHMLQSAQEALEREVQKFREIGNENILVEDTSLDSCLPPELVSGGFDVHDPNSSASDHVSHSSHALEFEINSLKESVHLIESKLDKATTMLKVKEAKVGELEAKLTSISLKEEAVSGMEELHLENHLDTGAELESLFRQKVEAEVEYLTISRTIQNLRVVSVDQISILEEQRKLASQQSEMLNKLVDAESKTVKLKGEAEELENYCEEIVSGDEALMLQSSVCKYTSCFFIQLILLAVILGLFIMQFWSQSPGVVPT